MRNEVGLKEIAREANVSVMSVSLALNNRGRISAEKRSEICSIARKLSYAPRAAARILKSKRIADMGLVLFERESLVTGNAWTQNILIRFMAECRQAGRRFQVEWFDPEADPDSLPDLFTNGLVGGLLIHGIVNSRSQAFLDSGRIPFVRLDEAGPHAVRFNREVAFREAFERIRKSPFRKVGLFNGPRSISCFAECERIFRKLCAEFDLETREEWIYERPVGKPHVADKVQLEVQHLLDFAERPEVLFLSGAGWTQTFIYELQKHGVCVPRDLRIIAFQLLRNQATSVLPFLDSVTYLPDPVMKAAIPLLSRVMAGDTAEKTIWIDTEYVPGDSFSFGLNSGDER